MPPDRTLVDVPSGASATDAWQHHHDRLFGLAYRMLGSVSDAQDVLQDAWVRLDRVEVDHVRDTGAWLTTVVTRLCLNHLASARVRREQYVGPWLPEPVVTSPDPVEDTILAESVSAAFMVVLEVLSPAERVAFVLRDVFGHPFAEIAAIMGRNEAACRQLASRARRAVAAGRPRFATDADQRRAVTTSFLDACTGQDLAGLLAVLAPDVTLHNDGGGNVPAARRTIVGAQRVARFLVGVLTKRTDWRPSRVEVHGAPGVCWHDPAGRVAAVLSATVDDAGQVATIGLVVNPDKLRHLAP